MAKFSKQNLTDISGNACLVAVAAVGVYIGFVLPIHSDPQKTFRQAANETIFNRPEEQYPQVDVSYHYTVDKKTGLCFLEKGFPTVTSYSVASVPCTDKVIEQLPEELRKFADRKTGKFCQGSNPTTYNQPLAPNQ